MAIKSQMLLPKQEILIEENDPYEEDPRDMLVCSANWNTVKKYKYAAEQLSEKSGREEQKFILYERSDGCRAYKKKK